MLIEKERHYKVLQSYASRTENEFEVYDFNDNRVGYFVERDNQYEVYHNADNDFEDYTSIDYTDNYNDAVHMIIEEIQYDMN
jgi:hypothetical protein